MILSNRHPNEPLLGLAAAAAAITTCSTPKLCWDTAAAPLQAVLGRGTSTRTTSNQQQGAADSASVLLPSAGSSPVAQNPRPSYVFSTAIQVAHGSKRTCVPLFMNHVSPLLYTQPCNFVCPSTLNINIPPFLRSSFYMLFWGGGS